MAHEVQYKSEAERFLAGKLGDTTTAELCTGEEGPSITSVFERMEKALEQKLVESKQVWARELLKYRPSFDGTKTDAGIDCAQPPHRAGKLKTLLSSSASTDVSKQASIFGSNLELNRQLDGHSFNSTFESLLRDDKGNLASLSAI